MAHGAKSGCDSGTAKTVARGVVCIVQPNPCSTASQAGRSLRTREHSLDVSAITTVNPFAIDVKTGVERGLALEDGRVEFVREGLRHVECACE